MSKYNNKKTRVHGMEFASAWEAERYKQLYLLGKSGYISNLRTQVPYELIPAQYEMIPTDEVYVKGAKKGQQKYKKVCVEQSVKYIADFVYTENGKEIVEDTKSPATRKKESYIIKRKLMLHVHNIRLREVLENENSIRKKRI